MIQRDIEYSGQYSKDVKLAQKRHKDMNKLKYLMTLLINNTLPLPAVYKDHPLQGCPLNVCKMKQAAEFRSFLNSYLSSESNMITI